MTLFDANESNKFFTPSQELTVPQQHFFNELNAIISLLDTNKEDLDAWFRFGGYITSNGLTQDMNRTARLKVILNILNARPDLDKNATYENCKAQVSVPIKDYYRNIKFTEYQASHIMTRSLQYSREDARNIDRKGLLNYLSNIIIDMGLPAASWLLVALDQNIGTAKHRIPSDSGPAEGRSLSGIRDFLDGYEKNNSIPSDTWIPETVNVLDQYAQGFFDFGKISTQPLYIWQEKVNDLYDFDPYEVGGYGHTLPDELPDIYYKIGSIADFFIASIYNGSLAITRQKEASPEKRNAVLAHLKTIEGILPDVLLTKEELLAKDEAEKTAEVVGSPEQEGSNDKAIIEELMAQARIEYDFKPYEIPGIGAARRIVHAAHDTANHPIVDRLRHYMRGPFLELDRISKNLDTRSKDQKELGIALFGIEDEYVQLIASKIASAIEFIAHNNEGHKNLKNWSNGLAASQKSTQEAFAKVLSGGVERDDSLDALFEDQADRLNDIYENKEKHFEEIKQALQDSPLLFIALTGSVEDIEKARELYQQSQIERVDQDQDKQTEILKVLAPILTKLVERILGDPEHPLHGHVQQNMFLLEEEEEAQNTHDGQEDIDFVTDTEAEDLEGEPEGEGLGAGDSPNNVDITKVGQDIDNPKGNAVSSFQPVAEKPRYDYVPTELDLNKYLKQLEEEISIVASQGFCEFSCAIDIGNRNQNYPIVITLHHREHPSETRNISIKHEAKDILDTIKVKQAIQDSLLQREDIRPYYSRPNEIQKHEILPFTEPSWSLETGTAGYIAILKFDDPSGVRRISIPLGVDTSKGDHAKNQTARTRLDDLALELMIAHEENKRLTREDANRILQDKYKEAWFEPEDGDYLSGYEQASSFANGAILSAVRLCKEDGVNPTYRVSFSGTFPDNSKRGKGVNLHTDDRALAEQRANQVIAKAESVLPTFILADRSKLSFSDRFDAEMPRFEHELGVLFGDCLDQGNGNSIMTLKLVRNPSMNAAQQPYFRGKKGDLTPIELMLELPNEDLDILQDLLAAEATKSVRAVVEEYYARKSPDGEVITQRRYSVPRIEDSFKASVRSAYGVLTTIISDDQHPKCSKA